MRYIVGIQSVVAALTRTMNYSFRVDVFLSDYMQISQYLKCTAVFAQ